MLETRKQNTIKMALEAMHGFSKKSFTGNENFGLLGDEEDLDINRELAAAFPNSAEPMSILTPPFVSLSHESQFNQENVTFRLLFLISATIRARQRPEKPRWKR